MAEQRERTNRWTARAAALPRRTVIVGGFTAFLAACTSGGESDTASPTSSPTSSAATETASTESDTDTSQADAPSTSVAEPDAEPLEPLTRASFDELAICAVVPAAGTGPYPSLETLERRDITEGYPGHPVRLGIRVVDDACQPLPGATVFVWHTDLTGDYSSYVDNGTGKDEGEGTTFMRGSQTADDDGILEFHTIYPGWYPGRAIHIHATVVTVDGASYTTQLYFDEGYTASVFAEEPYAEFGLPDTGWEADGLAGDPASDGSGITLAAGATAVGPGTVGLVNLGIVA